MTAWTLEDLTTLASAPTLTLRTARAERPVRTWVVRLGRELYVRPAPGTDAAWAGAVLDGGHVAAGGRPVALAEAAPEVHAVLDEAYVAKYGRCAGERVADVVTDAAATATFRVHPRRATVAEAVSAAAGTLARRARSGVRSTARAARAVRPGRAPSPCPAC
ncbi:DUF2255 family protein [Isoptericola variabilis]|uniref:DUF2255 family protein n=1 Tax=Isoptericola variabilis (strain 225) TaxID=743718 RepID=F6FVL6_ISOV2|nr:DUF2255 family protein [Isoptericola variabilis]AEG44443.1 hypothetical protein Isova_1691 [Isoptericola variabilis 225]TWH28285.1 uncharacterized protein DUF2255 [Isoptericola variabilis J7]